MFEIDGPVSDVLTQLDTSPEKFEFFPIGGSCLDVSDKVREKEEIAGGSIVINDYAEISPPSLVFGDCIITHEVDTVEIIETLQEGLINVAENEDITKQEVRLLANVLKNDDLEDNFWLRDERAVLSGVIARYDEEYNTMRAELVVNKALSAFPFHLRNLISDVACIDPKIVAAPGAQELLGHDKNVWRNFTLMIAKGLLPEKLY